MRKLLIFILVVLAVNAKFDDPNNSLDVLDSLLDFDFDAEAFDWKEAWEKVKSGFLSVEKFLKDLGIWDPIVKAIKENLPKKVEEICVSYKIPEGLCYTIINWLVNHLK